MPMYYPSEIYSSYEYSKWITIFCDLVAHKMKEEKLIKERICSSKSLIKEGNIESTSSTTMQPNRVAHPVDFVTNNSDCMYNTVSGVLNAYASYPTMSVYDVPPQNIYPSAWQDALYGLGTFSTAFDTPPPQQQQHSPSITGGYIANPPCPVTGDTTGRVLTDLDTKDSTVVASQVFGENNMFGSTTMTPPVETNSNCYGRHLNSNGTMSHQHKQKQYLNETTPNNPHCLYGSNASLSPLAITQDKQNTALSDTTALFSPSNKHPAADNYAPQQQQSYSTKPPGSFRTMREYFTKSRNAQRNLKDMTLPPSPQTLPPSICREKPNDVSFVLSTERSDSLSSGRDAPAPLLPSSDCLYAKSSRKSTARPDSVGKFHKAQTNSVERNKHGQDENDAVPNKSNNEKTRSKRLFPDGCSSKNNLTNENLKRDFSDSQSLVAMPVGSPVLYQEQPNGERDDIPEETYTCLSKERKPPSIIIVCRKCSVRTTSNNSPPSHQVSISHHTTNPKNSTSSFTHSTVNNSLIPKTPESFSKENKNDALRSKDDHNLVGTASENCNGNISDDSGIEGSYTKTGIVVLSDFIKTESHEDSPRIAKTGDSLESELGSHLCLGCQKPVCDRYVLHVRDHGYWHADCLKCSNCHDNLSTHKSCYVKNEQVFCRNDYNILFGQSCVKCSLQFKKEKDWMRIAGRNRYHIACFLCKICKRQLGNNEKYHLVNGTDIYCTNHYRDMVSGDSSEDGQQPAKKAKRNRTSYTEAQIKFLQDRFLHDSNPDGNELEKIANHISLKKRVVQVWFQNNRARLKKTANNTKGCNPDNCGQPNSSGRVSTPGSLSDNALGIEWDNSHDPNSLDDQGYLSPGATTATTPTQQQLHHHHSQQQPPHMNSYQDLYGLQTAMNVHMQGANAPHHNLSGDAVDFSGLCGPNDQQISPDFPDVSSGSFHGSDTMNIASPPQQDANVSGGEVHSDSNCADFTKKDDGNTTPRDMSSAKSDCGGKSSPLDSLRNALSGEKYLDTYRRLNAREQHEQQILQMMQYHEQQQQLHHHHHQQQLHPHYHYPQHFIPGHHHMTMYSGGNGGGSGFGLAYQSPYGVPAPFSPGNLAHGMMGGSTSPPTNFGEVPQNFLQQQNHLRENESQENMPSNDISEFQKHLRNKKETSSGNDDDLITNNNSNNNLKHENTIVKKRKANEGIYDSQVTSSSSLFPHRKMLDMFSSQSTDKSDASYISPDHNKGPSPSDFTKINYNDPSSYGRSGLHSGIHSFTPNHGSRFSGEVHHFGNPASGQNGDS